MSKPTTWKACQEELEDAQKRIATLTAERDALQREVEEQKRQVHFMTAANDLNFTMKEKCLEERDAAQVATKFTKLVMEKMDEWEFSLDGADIQELAVEAGVLVEVKYDPAVHGENADVEPGDPWYVFSDAYRQLTGESA